MKYAIVNGQRLEAQPGIVGNCMGCGHLTVAKCGNIKIHHWAHKSKIDCDPWWENETEWHRSWKGKFPESWQEVVHRSDTGEYHRADVKTDKDWILEIQYSAISSEERASRNAFYGKIVWIVNGLRRKKDPVQFFNSLKVVKNLEDSVFRRACDVTSEKSALLRDWRNSNVPIFFDFNEPEVLWCLLPRSGEGKAVVVEVVRQRFIDLHLFNSSSPRDIFGNLIHFVETATSADDLFLKFHGLRQDQERHRQLLADEARRRNPYINHRVQRRF